jgi:hypothetical protein
MANNFSVSVTRRGRGMEGKVKLGGVAKEKKMKGIGNHGGTQKAEVSKKLKGKEGSEQWKYE